MTSVKQCPTIGLVLAGFGIKQSQTDQMLWNYWIYHCTFYKMYLMLLSTYSLKMKNELQKADTNMPHKIITWLYI